MPGPLFVARHAESVLGAKNIVNGDPSVENPLTERGRDQAREVGAELAGVVLELCVTTGFRRTQETAEVILGERDVPRRVIADLNDPRQGNYEGKPFPEYAEWMDGSGMTDPIPGGGESQLECVTRYARGWRAAATAAEGPVLVVAHAFPISVALTLHEDDPPMLRRNYERDPAFAELNVFDPEKLLQGLDRLDEELAAV